MDIIKIKDNDRQCIISRIGEYDFDVRDYDTLGIMVMFHRRYAFPNETDIEKYEADSWSELKSLIEEKYKPLTILELRLFDHSGLSLTSELRPFELPYPLLQFDTMKVGYIFTTQERVDMYGMKDKSIENLNRILDLEVKEYDRYLRGESYTYRIEKIEKCSRCGNVKTIIERNWGIDLVEFDDFMDNLPKPFKKLYKEGKYETMNNWG